MWAAFRQSGSFVRVGATAGTELSRPAASARYALYNILETGVHSSSQPSRRIHTTAPLRKGKKHNEIALHAPRNGSALEELEAATHRSGSESAILEKIAWVSDKVNSASPDSFFTRYQALSIESSFRDVRWACKEELWHQVMRMWLARARACKDKDDIDEACKHVSSHFESLMASTKVGVHKMSKEPTPKSAKGTSYPSHILNFSLRPTAETFRLAMEAHIVSGRTDTAVSLWHDLSSLRLSAPKPDEFKSQRLGVNEGLFPMNDEELQQKALIATRMSELMPTSATVKAAVEAAVTNGDNALADVSITMRATFIYCIGDDRSRDSLLSDTCLAVLRIF